MCRPGSNKVHQFKVGYNNFDWTNAPLPEMEGSPQYDFPGLTIGAPYNFPQHPRQNNWEGRYDLNWNKGTPRHQDRRRVHARAAHRRLVHPGDRPLHDVERAVESRRAHSCRARRSIRRSGISRASAPPRCASIRTTRTAAGRTSSTRRVRPMRSGLATTGG